MVSKEIEELLKTHPCYNENAHRKFARMHLPVAPKCNIQCNYCNRKYDCSNESRPGVTSQILSPREAVEKIREVRKKIPELKVIAIAGPGDPLANEETFETLSLVKKEFPEMTLCVSTNGLMLPDSAERLYAVGVRFLTVTMNAVDPSVSDEIYSAVVFGGKRHTGRGAAEILLKRQLEGIEKCVKLGMAVKINIVMIPGINDSHIPEIVSKAKSMGVYIINILPLIPVEGTKFSTMRSPTPEERKQLMDLCSKEARMMRHCRQCRADAIGLLDNDRSSEFVRPCGCHDRNTERKTVDVLSDEKKIAVATSDGKTVDCGFGNASVFKIYVSEGNVVRFLNDVKIDTSSSVSGQSHAEHIKMIIEKLSDCIVVIVKEIGPMPEKLLSDSGKKIFLADGSVDSAITESLTYLFKE